MVLVLVFGINGKIEDDDENEYLRRKAKSWRIFS